MGPLHNKILLSYSYNETTLFLRFQLFYTIKEHFSHYFSHTPHINITDQDDYTHAIIINTVMPTLTIPKRNVIGLAYEPLPFLGLSQTFIQYAVDNIHKYYIGDCPPGLPDLFVAGNAFLTYNTPPRVLPTKSKPLSIMVSQKRYAPGHIYRHTLVQAILASSLPIDIFGRGCADYANTNDPRLKCGFNQDDNILYAGYNYHIAIENYRSRHYFSEKIINPLLCGTIPVYLGCVNIEQYFPDNVILLSGDVERDMELLSDIIASPEKYHRDINIEHIENRVDLLANLGSPDSTTPNLFN